MRRGRFPKCLNRGVICKMSMGSFRQATRWIVLIGGVLLGLLYLNGAAGSWWVSWGPPNEYPKAWEQQAIVQFGLAVVCFVTGPTLFVFLKDKRSKLVYVWLIVVLLCLGYPEAREWMDIDKCLNAGGAWRNSHFDCRFQ